MDRLALHTSSSFSNNGSGGFPRRSRSPLWSRVFDVATPLEDNVPDLAVVGEGALLTMQARQWNFGAYEPFVLDPDWFLLDAGGLGDVAQRNDRPRNRRRNAVVLVSMKNGNANSPRGSRLRSYMRATRGNGRRASRWRMRRGNEMVGQKGGFFVLFSQGGSLLARRVTSLAGTGRKQSADFTLGDLDHMCLPEWSLPASDILSMLDDQGTARPPESGRTCHQRRTASMTWFGRLQRMAS